MSLAIATHIRPPEESSLGNINPMTMMSDMFKLRMNMQEYGARQAFGQTLATSPDTESAIRSWQQNPMAGFFPEGLTQLRGNQLLESQLQTQGLERQRIGAALAGQRITNLMDVNKQSLLNSPTPEMLEKNTSDLLRLLPSEDQKDGAQFLKDRNDGILGNLPPPGDPNRQNRYNLNTHGLMVTNGMTSDEVYKSRGFLPQGVEVGPYGPGGAQQATPAFGYPGVTPGGGITPGGSVPPPPQLSLGQTTPGATPAGPGVPTGITPEQQRLQESRGTELAGYKSNLEDNVDTGSRMMMQVAEAKRALAMFEAGPGATKYQQAAEIAAAAGAPAELVAGIAHGDLSAMQEFQKLKATQAMANLDSTLPSGSRTNQREWQAYLDTNPGPDMLPGAINRIYDLWTRGFIKNRIELSSLNSFLEKGGSMENWRNNWFRLQGNKGLLKTDYEGKDPKGNRISIPPAAVLNLLDHPETAADFESSYGKGSANRFLSAE